MAKQGHTRISHDLLEALSQLRGAELQVLLVVIRKILGWKKRRNTMQDRISLSQFEVATGLSKTGVRDALEKLDCAGSWKGGPEDVCVCPSNTSVVITR